MSQIPNYKPEEHTATLADLCLSRRQFLERSGMGMGALSLASILGAGGLGGSSAHAAPSLSPLAPRAAHFPVKAKAVIHIFAEGGPSQVDTWDPKPALAEYA